MQQIKMEDVSINVAWRMQVLSSLRPLELKAEA
jgi:hypothetical protein